MARIDLSIPYERFLRKQVESGLFSSITAAAENAIGRQMELDEERRIKGIYALIAKGESDIKQGRTVPYTPTFIDEVSAMGKEASLLKKPIKSEVK